MEFVINLASVEIVGLVALLEKGSPLILLALLIMTIVNTLSIRALFKFMEKIVWRETYKSDLITIDTKIGAVGDRVTKLENVK